MAKCLNGLCPAQILRKLSQSLKRGTKHHTESLDRGGPLSLSLSAGMLSAMKDLFLLSDQLASFPFLLSPFSFLPPFP